MADKETEVYYRLARSIVRITGSVTRDFDPKSSRPRSSATSDVELDVEAEPRLDWRCRLPMGSHFMKDKQFELTFTADGRLSSSKASASGAGAALLEAGIRVGTFVGASLLGAFGGRFAAPARGAKSFAAMLKEENKDLHERREAFRAAVLALQKQLAEEGKQTARDPASAAHLRAVRVLAGTLERVRAEAEEVEAEYDGWLAKRFPASSEEHTFVIGTDELPQLDAATPASSFTLNRLAPALRAAAETLGVVVARVAEVEEDALNFTPEDLERLSGIWFRHTRATALAIYEREPGTTGPFTLRSVRPVWVVDSDSRLGFIRFDSGIFEKQTGALGFGDSGGLSSLSSTDESPARQLSAAFAAAPGQVKEALEQASAVNEAVGKLRAAGAERELTDVERRRKLLEAEIAEKGVLATRKQREELERLKVRAEIADARKKLKPEPTPPASPTAELETKVARAKLELELKQAEVELEWLKRDQGGA